MIGIIVLVAIVSIIGWQIQSHVSLSTHTSTPSPTVLAARTLDYIEQFLHPSLTKQTLHKLLPQWKDKILQMETLIKQFMDQKIAIQQLFRNVSCTQTIIKGVEFNIHLYSFVSNSTPTIGFSYITNTIWLDIDEFDFSDLCKSENGWITTVHVSGASCDGTVDLT